MSQRGMTSSERHGVMALTVVLSVVVVAVAFMRSHRTVSAVDMPSADVAAESAVSAAGTVALTDSATAVIPRQSKVRKAASDSATAKTIQVSPSTSRQLSKPKPGRSRNHLDEAAD